MAVTQSLESKARTGDLVLKTRIALVIRNLQHVQGALDTVKQRRSYFRKLLMFPGRAQSLIDDIGTAFNSAAESVERGALREAETALNTVSTRLEDLAAAAADCEIPVAELRSAATVDEAEVKRTDDIADTINGFLRGAVTHHFGNELKNLEALRGRVKAANEDGGDNADIVMRTAWSEYTDQLYNNSERLFEEYVDLVSGVAIRDVGLDRGISRLAEGLLEPGGKIGTFIWNTLTIPAREEALAVTAARIVRLGFPEWTIWTLPLAAYELGTNYADSDKQVAEMIGAHIAGHALPPEGEAEEGTDDRPGPKAEDMPEDKSQLYVLVADAFATCFLGPAYACSAILMRLNPAQAFSSDRLIAKRAATVFTVLTRMSESAGGVEDHYGEITRRLAVEWSDALRQTGWAGPTPEEAEGPSPALRELTGVTVREQIAIEHLVDAFEPLVFGWILADSKVWPEVEECAAKLRQGRAVVADLGKLNEMRYVLNAAWRARIAVRLGELDIEDPRRLTEISTTVEKRLWNLLEPADQTVDGDGTGPGPQVAITRYSPGQRLQSRKETGS